LLAVALPVVCFRGQRSEVSKKNATAVSSDRIVWLDFQSMFNRLKELFWAGFASQATVPADRSIDIDGQGQNS